MSELENREVRDPAAEEAVSAAAAAEERAAEAEAGAEEAAAQPSKRYRTSWARSRIRRLPFCGKRIQWYRRAVRPGSPPPFCHAFTNRPLWYML